MDGWWVYCWVAAGQFATRTVLAWARTAFRRSRFDGGRIVLGGGMYVAKWSVEAGGIRSSTVIRVESVVLKEGCWG
jgi:hypothetical protein